LKAALVGTGRIARQHLACLNTLEDVSLTAVCDLSAVSAEAAAERYGVEEWFTDYSAMLAEIRPDVVHVTTPPRSHFPLAMEALDSGSHVIVEKPAGLDYDEVSALIERAEGAGKALVENYNYVFNPPVQQMLALIEGGDAGKVIHVDISLCEDITGEGSPFVDRNVPHPALSLRGGAIGDFLPHLASLTHALVGPHRTAATIWKKLDPSTPLPSDEFRGFVDAERGTATLSFSGHTRPDVFAIRLQATRMRASASLYEPSLMVDRTRPLPNPLVPVANGFAAAREASRAAIGGLAGKLSGGPGSYEGLWELLRRTYGALASGSAPPVSLRQVDEVNRLVAALTDESRKL
jgi:predicted dehydrogenase